MSYSFLDSKKRPKKKKTPQKTKKDPQLNFHLIQNRWQHHNLPGDDCVKLI